MRLLQAQTLFQPEFANESNIDSVSVVSRVKALFAALVYGFTHAEHDVGTRLGGHAWTDSLEREVNNDIAMCRRLRL